MRLPGMRVDLTMRVSNSMCLSGKGANFDHEGVNIDAFAWRT